ncbi:hypothetical protein [Streptomyces sp. NPDC056464]|uniref:hypothetical protein n=1 Tax=Streptomyces sp. NPDC056464 TaxID=3345828 RepID=UPI0036A100A8
MRVENLTDTTFEDLFFIFFRKAVDRMDDPDEMYSAAWSPKGARLQPQPPAAASTVEPQYGLCFLVRAVLATVTLKEVSSTKGVARWLRPRACRS